jgi:PilZ domain-containing protein
VARRLNDHDRRLASRVAPQGTPWHPVAILRPGQEVHVINLSSGGALIESANRMNPGTRTELQLFGAGRRSIPGRIERCTVTRLDPLRYQGAIVFERQLEWHE